MLNIMKIGLDSVLYKMRDTKIMYFIRREGPTGS